MANGLALSREPRKSAFESWPYAVCGSSAAAPG